MSASAVKSSMSGVGNSPPAPAHSIIPMNVMAQKVPATGNEPASIKPLNTGGLSYVTLQPPNQPLSLVQDHRPAPYQNTSYMSNNTEKEKEKEKEKEAEAEKIVQNGVEATKANAEQEIPPSAPTSAPIPVTLTVPAPPPPQPTAKQQIDGNRNNNQSPENPAPIKQEEIKAVSETTPAPHSEFPVTACPPATSKVEEKKTTPVKNGSKPETPAPATQAAKISPHKQEDQSQTRSTEVAIPKPKPSVQSATSSAKPPTENPASTQPPKAEPKIVGTPRTVKRKSRELKDLKGGSGEGGSKPKRNRVQTQPYQSPLPEIALIVKTLTKPPPSKNADDKLIVFYKNEFLAVRNAEGSFYVCQAMQNIYKSSRRIRIRWLSQDKNNGEIYSPDFYDFTDFDCILTNLNLNKIDKNKFQLTKFELLRTENILKRAIDVEAGVSEKPRVTEEHPDGLDLSLYKDESQLKRRKRAAKEKQRLRKRSKRDSSSSSESSSSSSDEEPVKKVSPKLSRVKKGSMNKALAIAKSVAKGPSRAKRALNRAAASNKPTASLAGNSVTSSSAEAAKRSAPETSKKLEPKKMIVKQQSTVASGTSRTSKPRGAVQPAPESSSSSSGSGSSTARAKRAAAGSAPAVAPAPAASSSAAVVPPPPPAPSAPSAPPTQSTEDSSIRKKLRTTRA